MIRNYNNPNKRPWREVLRAINQERSSLETLYLSVGVAIDQLGLRPLLLVRLTDLFNEAVQSEFRPGEILRYLLLRRKNSDWIRLGAIAKRMTPLHCSLTLAELTALKVVYSKIDHPLDDYLLYPTLADRLALGFKVLTGVERDKWQLVGFAMYKRKIGEWFCFTDDPNPFFAEIPSSLLDELDEALAV